MMTTNDGLVVRYVLLNTISNGQFGYETPHGNGLVSVLALTFSNLAGGTKVGMYGLLGPPEK